MQCADTHSAAWNAEASRAALERAHCSSEDARSAAVQRSWLSELQRAVLEQAAMAAEDARSAHCRAALQQRAAARRARRPQRPLFSAAVQPECVTAARELLEASCCVASINAAGAGDLSDDDTAAAAGTSTPAAGASTTVAAAVANATCLAKQCEVRLSSIAADGNSSWCGAIEAMQAQQRAAYAATLASIDAANSAACAEHSTLQKTRHTAELSAHSSSDTKADAARDQCTVTADMLAHLGPAHLLTALELCVEGLTAVGASLQQCTALRSLSLSVNRLSSVAPLAANTALEALSLKDNRISSLAGLSALTQLRSLLLDVNQLRSLVHMQHLPRLTELSVVSNRVAALPQQLPLPALQRLDLQHNSLHSLPQRLLCGLSQLTHLNLGRNKLGSSSRNSSSTDTNSSSSSASAAHTALGQALTACPSLTILVLSGNGLTAVPSPLRLPLLRELWLSGNRLTSLAAWAAAGATTTAATSSSSSSSSTAQQQQQQQQQQQLPQVWLPSLHVLHLQDNALATLAGCAALASMPLLRSLDLSFNALTGLALAPLRVCTQLRRLAVHDNPATTEPQHSTALLLLLPWLRLLDGEAVRACDAWRALCDGVPELPSHSNSSAVAAAAASKSTQQGWAAQSHIVMPYLLELWQRGQHHTAAPWQPSQQSDSSGAVDWPMARHRRRCSSCAALLPAAAAAASNSAGTPAAGDSTQAPSAATAADVTTSSNSTGVFGSSAATVQCTACGVQQSAVLCAQFPVDWGAAAGAAWRAAAAATTALQHHHTSDVASANATTTAAAAGVGSGSSGVWQFQEACAAAAAHTVLMQGQQRRESARLEQTYREATTAQQVMLVYNKPTALS
jgi:Leucine-rich repeat (LRR) protein